MTQLFCDGRGGTYVNKHKNAFLFPGVQIFSKDQLSEDSRSVFFIDMQTDDGQIVDPYSISAGLDYPGIGPQHSFLLDNKRVKFLNATDDEAINAAFDLTKLEGIIPALETAHALAALDKLEFKKDDIVVLNLSGRGDKDLKTYFVNWI